MIQTLLSKICTIFVTILIIGLATQYANAQTVPEWVKNNAKWWSEGAISENDFVSGLQYLIQEGILKVPKTDVSQQKSSEIPDWIKNNAKWWAEGTITDADFLNGVQYLIEVGIITVADSDMAEGKQAQTGEMESLQAQLEKCQEIKKAYDRIQCEEEVEMKITTLEYKQNAKPYEVGQVTFYYPGAELEITSSGQANLYVTVLAENTGSENVILKCTGPSICNYDVWNGDKAFKYSSTDFTSGQIAIKPGEAREINFFFGPNIGYGGTQFEYDSTKDYFFRIFEPWGSAEIPLNLE